MEITCYRDTACSSEMTALPAATYNLAITLLSRTASGYLFVPIRPMQYLAILDHEEFVFIDGERKCWIDIAWQHFRPQQRESLEDPVTFEAIYYRPESVGLMRRLQTEFPLALRSLAGKQKLDGPARVLKFPSTQKP